MAQCKHPRLAPPVLSALGNAWPLSQSAMSVRRDAAGAVVWRPDPAWVHQVSWCHRKTRDNDPM
jgi:hypothetical protein